MLLLPDLFAQYDVRDVWDSGRLHDICGYRRFIEALAAGPGVEYHIADQDEGVREYEFAAKTCPGRGPLDALTLDVNLSSRIGNDPVPLGAGASMTFLHADGAHHSSPNEKSVVVRLDLGSARILLTGDVEAGGRKRPTVPPSEDSIEGVPLACCQQALAAEVLIVGHHGSRTSSRRAFLDAVMASSFVVSLGPSHTRARLIPWCCPTATSSLSWSRGQVFRTDRDDVACGQRPDKLA